MTRDEVIAAIQAALDTRDSALQTFARLRPALPQVLALLREAPPTIQAKAPARARPTTTRRRRK